MEESSNNYPADAFYGSVCTILPFVWIIFLWLHGTFLLFIKVPGSLISFQKGKALQMKPYEFYPLLKIKLL